MLPSMRYPTAKLTQLFHNRKSYKQHKQHIKKIKNGKADTHIHTFSSRFGNTGSGIYGPNPSTLRLSADQYRNRSGGRDAHLDQIRDRMHYSFNYTQYVRAKEINKDNHILYKKCTEERKSFISLRNGQKSPKNSINPLPSSSPASPQGQNPFSSQYLLRNHRQSPISKLTPYQRTKQNMRLAISISRPCPSINTRKLQQIHEKTMKLRQRIMKYDSSVSLKSTRYLDRRIMSENGRIDKSASISSRRMENSRDVGNEEDFYLQDKKKSQIKQAVKDNSIKFTKNAGKKVNVPEKSYSFRSQRNSKKDYAIYNLNTDRNTNKIPDKDKDKDKKIAVYNNKSINNGVDQQSEGFAITQCNVQKK